MSETWSYMSVLKSSSRGRSRSHTRYYRTGNGKNNWRIVLLFVFGFLGMSLVARILYKVVYGLYKTDGNRRKFVAWVSFLLFVIIAFSIPSIVFLATNPNKTVRIFSIVCLCVLCLPLLVLVPMVIRKVTRRHSAFNSDFQDREVQFSEVAEYQDEEHEQTQKQEDLKASKQDS